MKTSLSGIKPIPAIAQKELIDRIADKTQSKRVAVKAMVQLFLDEITAELDQGSRLEFRDFGVFEPRTHPARAAQTPKTLEKVEVPVKRTVKFRMGRMMREKVIGIA